MRTRPGSRRSFLTRLFLWTLVGCTTTAQVNRNLVLGLISHGQETTVLQQFASLQEQMGQRLKSRILLEPAFSESLAIQRLQDYSWDLIFAPPGLAAIAISRHQYTPLFPLESLQQSQSIFLVAHQSPIQYLHQLNHKAIALGQPGSATGYYLPLYNLYGLTIAKFKLAPTPQTILDWISNQTVDAGAMSQTDLEQLIPHWQQSAYRVIFQDSRSIPPGVILMSPRIERNHQEKIRTTLTQIPSEIQQAIGYSPTAPVPDYRFMIAIMERVQEITGNLRERGMSG
ncbi:MAG: phosphate/phosphite/phosphonate ABC transporter substrate-binding protein [Oculatellaceae cyanobacterium Prado106]|jgi:phosphonate transport system substrate-binding protein|nr:phosphate/phosphite/phosphonate ABC transporter substrate-binding protein [Oculatellaceae cyanobacterium Prado106]